MAKCAFALVHKDQKVLLVNIAHPFRYAGHWNFPGGVIEENEGLRSGAEREILEETGIVCQTINLLENFTTTNPNNEIFIFDAIYKAGDFQIQEQEIQEAGWFTYKEALELPLAFDIKRTLLESNAQFLQNV